MSGTSGRRDGTRGAMGGRYGGARQNVKNSGRGTGKVPPTPCFKVTFGTGAVSVRRGITPTLLPSNNFDYLCHLPLSWPCNSSKANACPHWPGFVCLILEQQLLFIDHLLILSANTVRSAIRETGTEIVPSCRIH